MARWAIIVWVGLAVTVGALFLPGVLSNIGPGPFFWTLAVLLVACGVLAWMAAHGARRAPLLLVVAGGALAGVTVFAAVIVLGLSVGQSPVIELVGWLVVALGAAVVLAGSIAGLRGANSTSP